MAVSPFVPSSPQKLRINDVQNNRPNSEAVNAKLASSINYLIERTFNEIIVSFNGYFANTNLFEGAPIRIPNQSVLTYYQLGILDTGSVNATSFNFKIYDASGAFVSNLFGSGANKVSLSGSNGSNVVIGRDLVANTTFQTNTAGHTVEFGNNTLTDNTLNAGWLLVPFVEDFAIGARSINFILRLQEQ
jgi:hypothetical protein